jgi:hypothetical protein
VCYTNPTWNGDEIRDTFDSLALLALVLESSMDKKRCSVSRLTWSPDWPAYTLLRFSANSAALYQMAADRN